VRVCHKRLDVSPEELAQCRELLNAEERARADRFHFERHARRFTVARAFLRTILGEIIGRPVEFVFSQHGKPALAGGEVEFNLSHSHELAVIAIADTPVGIDVEQVRPMRDALAIAKRFFAPDEIEVLERADDRDRAFFRCWTAKEAYLKARAEGIGLLPLDSFSVSEEPALIRADDDDPHRWTMSRPDVPDGYLCTVALTKTSTMAEAAAPRATSSAVARPADSPNRRRRSARRSRPETQSSASRSR